MPISPTLERLRSDRRAVAGIIFAGSALAIAIMAGLAIDFSGAVHTKAKMQIALDAGLLTTVNKAVDLYKADRNTDFAAAIQAGTDRFNAQVGSTTDSDLPMVSFAITKTTNKYVASAITNGIYNTVLGNIVDIPHIPISLNGSVTIYTAEYIDATVLIDRSESMLVGGSDTDRNNLAHWVNLNQVSTGVPFAFNNWTGSGCYFACHFDPGFRDFYGASRANSVGLRIDQMEHATAQLVTGMQTADTDTQYRFAAYSISTDLRSEAALSSDLSPGLSLSIAPDLVGSGGAPDTFLTQEVANFGQNFLPTAGDGTSASAPKQVVILMSDGIDDVHAHGGEPGYTCCGRIQYALNSGNMEDDNGATNACDILKAKGATVAVIQTRNWDPAGTGTDEAYYTAVQLAAAANMKACASSIDLYAEVDNTADFTTAINTILQTALAIPARFTR